MTVFCSGVHAPIPIGLGHDLADSAQFHHLLGPQNCPAKPDLPRTVVSGVGPCQSMPAIPTQYPAFWDMFKERGANQLLPHHPCDCTISLIPREPLSSKQLYSLSELEQVALQEFLTKGFGVRVNLAVHFSPSPACQKEGKNFACVMITKLSK